jgi:hypothetical protein
LVKAGYVEFENRKPSKRSAYPLGVPQGGIVSPILSNLYLHELDLFVEKLINQQNDANKGQKPTRRNPEYDRVMDKIQGINKTEKRWAASGKALDAERAQLRLDLIKVRSKLTSSIPNEGVAKIYYVRYADD